MNRRNRPRAREGKRVDDLVELIKELKEKRPEIYRHIVGLIKALLQ
jgi:hypothetical protein